MRKSYLDNLRWGTVCLVVLYHVIYLYNGVQPFGVIGPFRPVQYQDAYQYLVYPWFMALLFAVAGASSRLALEHQSHKDFLKARTRKLLVPSTIGLLVFGWVQGWYNTAISGGFSTMPLDSMPKPVLWLILSVSGTGVLWFIQVLWVLSLVLAAVRKVEKDRLYAKCGGLGLPACLGFTLLFWAGAQVLNTPIITVYRFGAYGVSFFVGYFVLSQEKVVDRLAEFRLPLFLGALLLGILYTCLSFGENYAVEPNINSPLACIFGWIAVLAAFAMGKGYWDRESPFTRWMGKHSWGLYIFHYLPLSMVGYYMNLYSVKLPIPMYYFISLISGFLGACLLEAVISRIPVLRWCILGIRKEKKHVSR